MLNQERIDPAQGKCYFYLIVAKVQLNGQN